MSQSEAGKGDAPRKQQDQKAYDDGWDRIFSKKKYPEERKCSDHPDAPHGFLRSASHSEDRYVCECEYWEPPEENVNG